MPPGLAHTHCCYRLLVELVDGSFNLNKSLVNPWVIPEENMHSLGLLISSNSTDFYLLIEHKSHFSYRSKSPAKLCFEDCVTTSKLFGFISINLLIGFHSLILPGYTACLSYAFFLSLQGTKNCFLKGIIHRGPHEILTPILWGRIARSELLHPPRMFSLLLRRLSSIEIMINNNKKYIE